MMNNSFESVPALKYLGRILTHQSHVYEEIKCIFNLWNGYYHSVQNLSSRLLSTNIRIKICKMIILHIPVFGCET
jgi:hypothetical protein